MKVRSAYAMYAAYTAGVLVHVISFSGVVIELSRLVCVSRFHHVATNACGPQLVPRTVSPPLHNIVVLVLVFLCPPRVLMTQHGIRIKLDYFKAF